MKRLLPSIGAVAILVLALSVARVSAATNLVRMLGTLQFQPQFLTNNVGDTVLWTNTSLTFAHNVVSSNNAWASVTPFTAPGTFRITFTNAGLYGYYCAPHLLAGMTGIIYVQGPSNAPPVVTLTNPAPGAVFAAPANIALRAFPSDPDGNVANVQFYSGAALIGTVTNSPFNFIMSNLAAGPYSFKAVAFDNAGAGATSAVVSVSVVAPGPIWFDTNNLNIGGTYPLRLMVTTGLSYAIDYSLTLTNWLLFTNFTATNTLMTFSHPKTDLDHRFFRARLLPNP